MKRGGADPQNLPLDSLYSLGIQTIPMQQKAVEKTLYRLYDALDIPPDFKTLFPSHLQF